MRVQGSDRPVRDSSERVRFLFPFLFLSWLSRNRPTVPAFGRPAGRYTTIANTTICSHAVIMSRALLLPPRGVVLLHRRRRPPSKHPYPYAIAGNALTGSRTSDCPPAA